jgi:intron-binding protein aquarius
MEGLGSQPPTKRARPTALDDVVLLHADGTASLNSAETSGQPQQRKGAPAMLTLTEIATDRITKIAQANWSAHARSQPSPPAFSPELVKSIYDDELGGKGRSPGMRRIMVLEISQYLESYLWPNFDSASASFEHVMSILLMVNEKFRENVPAWSCFHTRKVG